MTSGPTVSMPPITNMYTSGSSGELIRRAASASSAVALTSAFPLQSSHGGFRGAGASATWETAPSDWRPVVYVVGTLLLVYALARGAGL